jgi:hypothetical protein
MAGVQRYEKVVQISHVKNFRLYHEYRLPGNAARHMLPDQQTFTTHVNARQGTGSRYWQDELYKDDRRYILGNMQRVLPDIIEKWNGRSPRTVLKCGVFDSLPRVEVVDPNDRTRKIQKLTTRFMFATEDPDDDKQLNYMWHFFLSDEDQQVFNVKDFIKELGM